MRALESPIGAALLLSLGGLPAVPLLAQNDPLPSWRDTAPKDAIVAFVDSVTTEGSSEFVPERERIAVFDNDGTLWAEQPLYVQARFIADRVRALAPEHPEWRSEEPFASLLEGDLEGVAAAGEAGLAALAAVTHAGMTDACRHDHGGVRRDGRRVDRDRDASGYR